MSYPKFSGLALKHMGAAIKADLLRTDPTPAEPFLALFTTELEDYDNELANFDDVGNEATFKGYARIPLDPEEDIPDPVWDPDRNAFYIELPEKTFTYDSEAESGASEEEIGWAAVGCWALDGGGEFDVVAIAPITVKTMNEDEDILRVKLKLYFQTLPYPPE